MTDPSFPTASWARRILALVVDWFACALVVACFRGPTALPLVGGFFGSHSTTDSASSVWTFVAFILESALFSALAGGSFGKIATRLRTVRVSGDPRPINLIGALARQILVAVVVPPLIFKPDGRGLHDLAVGSATVTLETWRGLARVA